MAVRLTVNGRERAVEAPPEMPLLWALRDVLDLTGTKFGCGAGLCGACTVHVDGRPARSCLLTLAAVAGSDVRTVEGLSEGGTHPVQRAWVEEDVAQCGYCQAGQIMTAAALLERSSRPTRDEIVQAMAANLCRCGTYDRIFRAVERAAELAAEEET